MNYRKLKEMADSLPDEALPDFFPSGRIAIDNRGVGHDLELTRFVLAYRDPGFGWKYAQWWSRRARPMPVVLSGRDEPLVAAFLHGRDKQKFKDPHMTRALALTSTRFREEEAIVKALLLSRTKENAIEEASRRVKWPKRALELYEKLFFNVADRKQDLLYIRSIVYPNGRLADMLRQKIELYESDGMLLRSGHDNGAGDVMYLSGLDDNPESIYEAADNSKKLETVMMAQAVVMARSGWMSLPSARAGAYSHARSLVQAGKLGGGTQQRADDIGLENIGATLLAEIQSTRLGQLQAAENIRKQRLAAMGIGKVIEAA